jgi:hypothetical protein
MMKLTKLVGSELIRPHGPACFWPANCKSVLPFKNSLTLLPDSAPLQPAATCRLRTSDSQYHDVLNASSISESFFETSLRR